MSDIERQKRHFNRVSVRLTVELDWKDEEYTMEITSFIGVLDIWRSGGTDDVSLIKDCIENHISEITMPKEGFVDLMLVETGEREDVFWNKYYVIESYVLTEF